MKHKGLFCGVDYGAKMAGTTAIAYFSDTACIEVKTSAKNTDADTFLLDEISQIAVNTVYIDAPLSLPGIYSQKNSCTDYFYRQCDKDLQAMSPMFLGGLTARAIRLKSKLLASNIECRESYPAYQAKKLGLKELGYKQKGSALEKCIYAVAQKYGVKIYGITQWHAFDALLALLAGIHLEKGIGEIIGSEEGYVYV